jgi:hypothetical protein
MPTPGQELASIDFESMLGGPLVAVVNAQAQSAMATVNFIKEVGFKKPSSDQIAGDDTETELPIYVKFKYKKGSGDDATEHFLEVPILTMLPIPYLRIDETTVDFKAKINSVSYRKTDTNLKIDSSLEAKAGWLWGSAKLKVNCSYQRNTQQGNTVNRAYSLDVHIKAVQDEMPAGMEKILDILEDSIQAEPTAENAPAET